MRGYLLHHKGREFLAFGPDCLAACEHVRAFGIDPAVVSVAYMFPIPQEGFACELGREFHTLRLADGRSVMGREVPGDMA